MTHINIYTIIYLSCWYNDVNQSLFRIICAYYPFLWFWKWNMGWFFSLQCHFFQLPSWPTARALKYTWSVTIGLFTFLEMYVFCPFDFGNKLGKEWGLGLNPGMLAHTGCGDMLSPVVWVLTGLKTVSDTLHWVSVALRLLWENTKVIFYDFSCTHCFYCCWVPSFLRSSK